MPFEPIGNGKYKSPSGRVFNEAQVRLWYANGEKFPGQKKSESSLGKQASSFKKPSKMKGKAKVTLTHQMLMAIKNSPKGVIPTGLIRRVRRRVRLNKK